jgi:hypothetical protein
VGAFLSNKRKKNQMLDWESRIQMTGFMGKDGFFYTLEWRPFMQTWVVWQMDDGAGTQIKVYSE